MAQLVDCVPITQVFAHHLPNTLSILTQVRKLKYVGLFRVSWTVNTLCYLWESLIALNMCASYYYNGSCNLWRHWDARAIINYRLCTQCLTTGVKCRRPIVVVQPLPARSRRSWPDAAQHPPKAPRWTPNQWTSTRAQWGSPSCTNAQGCIHTLAQRKTICSLFLAPQYEYVQIASRYQSTVVKALHYTSKCVHSLEQSWGLACILS